MFSRNTFSAVKNVWKVKLTVKFGLFDIFSFCEESATSWCHSVTEWKGSVESPNTPGGGGAANRWKLAGSSLVAIWGWSFYVGVSVHWDAQPDNWGSAREHLCHMWITSPQLQLCFTVGGGREQLELDPVGHTSAPQVCEGKINVTAATSSLLLLISLLKPGENYSD